MNIPVDRMSRYLALAPQVKLNVNGGLAEPGSNATKLSKQLTLLTSLYKLYDWPAHTA